MFMIWLEQLKYKIKETIKNQIVNAFIYGTKFWLYIEMKGYNIPLLGRAKRIYEKIIEKVWKKAIDENEIIEEEITEEIKLLRYKNNNKVIISREKLSEEKKRDIMNNMCNGIDYSFVLVEAITENGERIKVELKNKTNNYYLEGNRLNKEIISYILKNKYKIDIIEIMDHNCDKVSIESETIYLEKENYKIQV